MIARISIPVLLAAATLTATAPHAMAQTRAQASTVLEEARLAQLFGADARRQDSLDPMSPLWRGDPVDPVAFAQLFTPELERKSLAATREALRALGRINRARLGPERQISYDVFLLTKQRDLAALRPDMLALTAVRPFNHFGGLHVEFPSVVATGGALRYATEEDYARALALDTSFATVLDNAIVRFREGLRTGVVEPKLTVRNMIAQLDALLEQPLEQSPFYSPVLAFPDGLPNESRPKIRSAYTAMIRDKVNPAYRRLRDFLADEYLPAARDTVGLSTMKGGPTLYRQLIEQQTDLKLDPEEVHALGLAEVARIRGSMDGVRREVGFTGDLAAFFEHIRTDPHYHPKTAQELEAGFARIAGDVDRQIPRFFASVPRTKLIIRSYPAYREKFEPGGSYSEGAPDGSRPGTFFFNTYDLPSRYLTGMTTLYLHEAIPGHHFQISLAQENTGLPAFQRFSGSIAFVEGWALYAETIGYEMGLFKDPLQRWGTLDDEMLRAMRLVVDTGLHAKGWTREQAIDYMLANSGMGRTDATAEVERYIANPGQALAYKIGALTIQRLRKKAENALGARFDVRAFHEQALGSGALPMPVLEAKIDRWIASLKTEA